MRLQSTLGCQERHWHLLHRGAKEEAVHGCRADQQASVLEDAGEDAGEDVVDPQDDRCSQAQPHRFCHGEGIQRAMGPSAALHQEHT